MKTAVFPIQKLSDIELAFPTTVSHLMPKMEEIPEEFKTYNGTKWNKIQSDWFFSGLTNPEFVSKEGVNAKEAYRHLAAIQVSFEPKHKHKAAAVAYLMSLWFDDIKYKKVEK